MTRELTPEERDWVARMLQLTAEMFRAQKEATGGYHPIFIPFGEPK